MCIVHKHTKYRCWVVTTGCESHFWNSARFNILTIAIKKANDISYESPNTQQFGARRTRACHYHGGITPTCHKRGYRFTSIKNNQCNGVAIDKDDSWIVGSIEDFGLICLTGCIDFVSNSLQTVWYFVTKIVLTSSEKKLYQWLRKNFWNSRLKAENLQNFCDH